MHIEAAQTRRGQDRLGQDQAIGGHHRRIGPVGSKHGLFLGALEADGGEDGNAVALRGQMDGEGWSFLPRPAGRGGWL
jgi:hypothetical protein